MPTDVVVATEFSAKAEADVKSVEAVSSEEMILDIGPDSAETIARLVGAAGTILWNGPVGAFELQPFDRGTMAAARPFISATSPGSSNPRRRFPSRDRRSLLLLLP